MAPQGLTLLVGTTKGAFLVSEGAGAGWAVRGPFCDGWPINHAIADPGTGTIWAGGGGDWHGAGVWRSDDGGESWQVTRLTRGAMDDWAENDPDTAALIGWSPAPLPFGKDFVQVWSLGQARHQARTPHGKPRRWRDLGMYRGPDEPSLRRKLDPRRGGARPPHHRLRPGRPAKALGRHLGRRCLRQRGRRQDLGEAQPAGQCRGLRGIACTT